MAYATANGADVISADLHLPRGGVWRGNLTLDAPDLAKFPRGGSVALSTGGGVQWVGTVRRSGLSLGTAFAEIVGGAGKLPTELPPKGYRATTARIVLSDILNSCRERLSTVTDNGTLARVLPFWTRVVGPAGSALNTFVDELGDGYMWRVLRDGSVWVGMDSWKPSGMDYVLLQDEPAIGRMTVAADVLSVEPGQTLGGRRVSYVDHEITAEQIRTRIWTEITP